MADLSTREHKEAKPPGENALDKRIDAGAAKLLKFIMLNDRWQMMNADEKTAHLAFAATAMCVGIETEAFIRGRDAGEKIAKMGKGREREELLAALRELLAAFRVNFLRLSPDGQDKFDEHDVINRARAALARAEQCDHHWIGGNDGLWCTKCKAEQTATEG